MTTDRQNSPVLIVGAGIAGMAAGMLLAERGQSVLLLDAAPAIGGAMHLLDHTFPTNSCGICLMLPRQPALCPTLECDRHPNVRLLPYAELLDLDGPPGAFTATVRHKPRYVDPSRCTGCGECAAVCPVPRPHDHEGHLAPLKAIYRPAGLRAVPDTWVIDPAYCTRCGACVTACPEAAIDLDMAARDEQLAAGAVLLAPGFGPFDARLKGEYGYGVYDNVVTSIQFERMVSLAGSTAAHLARPSDGQAPDKVAFIQCVGSRDNLCGAGYCSSACCMYTAKQVALAKKAAPGLDVTVFHMDLRAFGKDFDGYLAGVQALPGVAYRRAMPSGLKQEQQTRDVRLVYAGEDGKLREEAFGLVVLALGFAPPPGMQAVARRLGVALNEWGFAATDGAHPARTGRAGVFVAGAFREPKDIPETVAEAAGAAAEVAVFLAAAGSEQPGLLPSAAQPAGLLPSAAQPAIRDVSEEAPRIGVFVCECGTELAPVEPGALAGWARGLAGVAAAQVVDRACTAAGRAAIRAGVEAQGLNRVVVAGCSPRLYADELEAVMAAAGLDARLLARVNLREQAVYPHRHNGGGAAVAAKARSLLGMAVASLRVMAGVKALALGTRQSIVPRALVVGGGAAGMSAALALAGQGVPVELVERQAELGGQWRHIRVQVDGLLEPVSDGRRVPGAGGSDPQAALAQTIEQVTTHPLIRVHLGAELKALAGRPGAYRATIAGGGGEETVEHGVLIAATGGHPATPAGEYLYGQHPAVMTQRELEDRLEDWQAGPLGDGSGQPPTVVMIQCAGSREPGRPYCSRVCCTQAVKNALRLKAALPGAGVYVLYRDVRTYGFREAAYQAARDAGVVFVRYEPQAKPRVRPAGRRVRVEVRELVTGRTVELAADALVLSVGIEPEAGAGLAAVLGAGLNRDGFFREEQPKMKPLDLGRGLFVAGLAHSPRFLDETVVQGQGAAMRAAASLAPGEVGDRPSAVWVNRRLCSFCGLCVTACPYGARVLNEDERVAEVDYSLCQGCGVCAVVCPNKATLQKTFEHKQLIAAVDAALA